MLLLLVTQKAVNPVMRLLHAFQKEGMPRVLHQHTCCFWKQVHKCGHARFCGNGQILVGPHDEAFALRLLAQGLQNAVTRLQWKVLKGIDIAINIVLRVIVLFALLNEPICQWCFYTKFVNCDKCAYWDQKIRVPFSFHLFWIVTRKREFH